MVQENSLVNTGFFPESEEIYSWINDLTQWTSRKTGTIEGKLSAEYIVNKFKEFGLEDVKIETVPSMCMHVASHSLEINGVEIESFYINGSNRAAKSGKFVFGADPTRDQFVYVGDGTSKDYDYVNVSGKIAVCDLRFLEFNEINIHESNCKTEVYDPDGKMKKSLKRYDYDTPNPVNWPYNYFRALKNGAKGFIGILNDHADDPFCYCKDYTSLCRRFGVKYMTLPGLFISRSSGNELKKMFDSGRTLLGKMKMTSIYEYKNALNVSGRLSARSKNIILMHSHYDAVFTGAAQDASGVSAILSLAKYFSKLPLDARKKTMMFAAIDTRYTDNMGHQGFIKSRIKAGDNIILDISIEQIGKEVDLDESYHFVETGETDRRLVYITNANGLVKIVNDTFRKYHLEKSIFCPVRLNNAENLMEYDLYEDEIDSDAYYFNEAGMHVISMVSGSGIMSHPSDKPSRIPLNDLKTVGMAFAEIATTAAEIL